MAYRKIIHLDLDAFFCSVEELLHPELVGKPFAVGGRPENRGVVSSCSYAARSRGISSAMPTSRALRFCPELILVPGNYREYAEKSKGVMAILGQVTALLEQVSIDEAFLDVSDIQKPGLEIAKEIQDTIWKEMHLPCSLGIATNKLVAKIATDAGKASHRGNTPPRAILEVPAGREEAFLAPMPVRALWGVGPKTAAKLEGLGIRTIGDLAKEPEAALIQMFGKYGADLSRHAHGISDSEIVTEHELKSISQEITFARDIRDRDQLEKTLRSLSDQVGFRLRKKGLAAKTIKIKIRWPDFSLQTRQVSLMQATTQDSEIYHAALKLFEALWDGVQPVRLIGVGVSGLEQDVHQLSLWDTVDEKERRLLEAMDELKDRFGRQIVRRGGTFHTESDD